MYLKIGKCESIVTPYNKNIPKMVKKIIKWIRLNLLRTITW